MALPKFIIVYSALKPALRSEFSGFVRSPFVSKREKLHALMNLIERLTDDEMMKSWSRNHFVKLGLKDGQEGEKQFNNLMSDLYKLMKKFLAWKQFEKNNEQKDLLIIENLLEKDIVHSAGKMIRKKANQKKTTNAEMGFKFNQLADQFHFQQTRKNDNSFLLNSQQHLDIFYLSAQLKIWCELLNRSNILSLSYDQEKLNRFITFLEEAKSDYPDQYSILIYYPILCWLIKPENDDWYFGYREKLFNHIKEFPEQEAKEIIAYVQNYCVKRINQGRNEFLNEWLEISKFMLPLNLLNEGPHLSQWTYKNIVTAALRLHEYDWAEQFIHAYYLKLPAVHRDNAYQYNLAVFYYESGDFTRAMQLLNKVHFSDANYYLDAKSILIKIFFEQNEYDALISLTESMKIYLLREKQLSKNQHLQYKYLFRYTVRLYKLRLNKGLFGRDQYIRQMEEIRHQILENSLVANKQWLLSKIENV